MDGVLGSNPSIANTLRKALNLKLMMALPCIYVSKRIQLPAADMNKIETKINNKAQPGKPQDESFLFVGNIETQAPPVFHEIETLVFAKNSLQLEILSWNEQ